MRVKEVIIIVLFSVLFLEYSIVSIWCTNGKQPFFDGKLKARTDWNVQDRTRLLKIFYETNTGVQGHHKRIKEKWDELNGMEMPQSAHNLYVQVTNWIKKGEAERLLTEEERQFCKYKARSKLNWTEEMRENLFKFYHESGPELWKKRSKMLRELWDKQYPQYRNVTTEALINQIQSLLPKRGETYTKIRGLKEDTKLDLLRCYYMGSKKKHGRLKMMREHFIERHPDLAYVTYNKLRHQVLLYRKKHPEIDEKISREFSTANLHNPSWAPGETSGSRQEETPYTLTFQGHDFHRRSDQYLGQNYYNPWIPDMTGGPSSSGHQNSPDVGTSHQNIPPSHLGEHSLRGSEQHDQDQRQRESSKGKEPALDLDLHLR